MPAASSSISSESGRQPGKPRLVTPGRLSAGSSGPCSTTSATAAQHARRSGRVAQRPDPRLLPPRGRVRRPPRRRRSRPRPPRRRCRSGRRAPAPRRAAPRSGSTSRRASRAPTPYGPPSLCAVKLSRSRPLRPKSTGRWPTAWTASLWDSAPCSAGRAAACSTGWQGADLVVGPHHRDQSRRRRRRPRPGPARIQPALASTGSQWAVAPAACASQATESSTAWCSTARDDHRGPAARRLRPVRRP